MLLVPSKPTPKAVAAAAAAARGRKTKKELVRSPSVEEILPVSTSPINTRDISDTAVQPPGLKKVVSVVKPGGKVPAKKAAGPVTTYASPPFLSLILIDTTVYRGSGRGRTTKKVVKSAEIVDSDSDGFECVYFLCPYTL